MTRLVLTLCIACALLVTRPAAAQDTFEELRTRTAASLESARTEMAAATDDAPMRAHLRHVDAMRAQFIAAHPDHPQTPILQIDRALDAFLNEYELDGLRLMSIYGVLLDEERERIDTIRTTMRDALTGIDQRIATQLDALEAHPDFADSDDLQLQRRTLARIHRDIRLPIARGGLAFLDAEFTPNLTNAERNELHRDAADQLLPVIDKLNGYVRFKVGSIATIAAASLRDEDLIEQARELTRGAGGWERDSSTDHWNTRPWPDGVQRVYSAEHYIFNAMIEARAHGPRKGLDAFRSKLIHVRSPLDGSSPHFQLAVARLFGTQLYLAANGIAARPKPEHFVSLTTNGSDSKGPIEFRRWKLAQLARHAPTLELLNETTPIIDAALLVAARDDQQKRNDRLDDIWPRVVTLANEGTTNDLLILLDTIIPFDSTAVETLRQAQALWFAIPALDDPECSHVAALLLTTLQDGRFSTQEVLGDDAFNTIVRLTRNQPRHIHLNNTVRDAWRRHGAWIALADRQPQFALNILDEQSVDHPAAYPLRIAALNALADAAESDTERTTFLERIIETADEGILLYRRDKKGTPVLETQLHLDAAAAHLDLDDVNACGRRMSQAAQGALNANLMFRAQQLQVRLTLKAGGIDAASAATLSLIQLSRQLHDNSIDPVIPLISAVLEQADDALTDRWTATTPVLTNDPLLGRCLMIIDALSDNQRRSNTMTVAPILTLAGRFDESIALWQDLAARIRPLIDPVRIGLAEARYLRHADDQDWEEAFTAFAAITAAEADPAARTRTQWLAHLRQLQILDQMQRNTEQIGPRLRRLRATGPELGGPAFAPAFDQLIRRYLASDDSAADDGR